MFEGVVRMNLYKGYGIITIVQITLFWLLGEFIAASICFFTICCLMHWDISKELVK